MLIYNIFCGRRGTRRAFYCLSKRFILNLPSGKLDGNIFPNFAN